MSRREVERGHRDCTSWPLSSKNASLGHWMCIQPEVCPSGQSFWTSKQAFVTERLTVCFSHLCLQCPVFLRDPGTQPHYPTPHSHPQLQQCSDRGIHWAVAVEIRIPGTYQNPFLRDTGVSIHVCVTLTPRYCTPTPPRTPTKLYCQGSLIPMPWGPRGQARTPQAPSPSTSPVHSAARSLLPFFPPVSQTPICPLCTAIHWHCFKLRWNSHNMTLIF